MTAVPCAGARPRLVIAGYGMVGHHLIQDLADRDGTDRWSITVVGEEPRPAYDRVALSSFFSGTEAGALTLGDPDQLARRGVETLTGERVVRVERAARVVVTDHGRCIPYDTLVLATGSSPFVPPIAGHDAPGCFVYRTIDDLVAIRDWAAGCAVGAVVGGGLLGLEAAHALRTLGLVTHVVEFAPRLMPAQLDDAGSAMLRKRIDALGVAVHTGCETAAVLTDERGGVRGLTFAGDQPDLSAGIVVFSAGIRPRDELARSAGLAVGERGGVLVDEQCRTSDERIFAIGECAAVNGRVYGLVAPGFDMARTVAGQLLGGDDRFAGADLSTKLKLLGIDVATFGDANGAVPGAESITFCDPVTAVYKRLVVDATGTRVLGGMLVGDASMYPMLLQMARGVMPTPAEPQLLIFPDRTSAATVGTGSLPDAATVCSCHNVTKSEICSAIRDGAHDTASIKKATRAGTGCGGCTPMLASLLQHELTASGQPVSLALCEHFAYTRQELFDIVRVMGVTSFTQLISEYGRGLGCEICKPAAASMFASRASGYILDGEQAALQDTNDHFLANLQRDGTYSVVPRVPGGEITPAQLIAIGTVAESFGLYTKITGGQRIDLFGARVEQLPAIWARLIEAGFESGHAYGKALRTVKSCVGSTWCRYGVQDSTTLAIELELRYRGLRAPHKIKAAVSGCVRECAEAQSKDFGVIATDKGWNLYVGGNGGMRPEHAQLFAADLDRDTLIGYLDRILMFYIRTAAHLERTATWLRKLEGGVEYLRAVVIDDSLGIADDLEADMARHIASYECEWKATLADPNRLRRFQPIVKAANDPASTWVDVCDADELTVERGACARIGEEEVAVFKLRDGSVYAIGNTDPFSGTAIMSRGIVGSTGETVKVASPMHKQTFDLRTGRCLEDPAVAVPVFTVRVQEGRVAVAAP